MSPMSAEIPAEALQLRSLVRADQTLELFLDMVPVSEPGPDEVVIRVEAAPLNPSDMGLLFGGGDMVARVAGGAAGARAGGRGREARGGRQRGRGHGRGGGRVCGRAGSAGRGGRCGRRRNVLA